MVHAHWNIQRQNLSLKVVFLFQSFLVLTVCRMHITELINRYKVKFSNYLFKNKHNSFILTLLCSKLLETRFLIKKKWTIKISKICIHKIRFSLNHPFQHSNLYQIHHHDIRIHP